MKRYNKLAVFGGTFSPVHNGHLCALAAYAGTVQPDVVYIIPTSVPPHKDRTDGATDEQRLAMLDMAIRTMEFPCEVIVSDIEIRRKGKSYTVHTVEALRELAEEITIFCGTDMLLTLDQWYDAERLLSMVSVAYMQREEDGRAEETLRKKAQELTDRYKVDLIALPPVSREISSHEIREYVHMHKDISAYVPHCVAQYIAQEGLYK